MLHRRQFVLGPRAVRPRPDWQARPVGPLTLSHCPDLRVEPVADAEGTAWCLVGLASQSDPARPDPVEAIRSAATRAVPDLYQTWAGRWLLVGNGRVHLDAAGLLGCYYRLDGGECWASSSAVLLVRPEETGTLEVDPRPLLHAHGVDWYPPPRSRFGPVRRLLPSQVLDLARGAVERRPLLPPLRRDEGYARIVERLEERLLTALARLPRIADPAGREGVRIWVPLTSGLDSRLVLAIAAHLAIATGTYTHQRRRLSIGDWLYPPRLAREVGLPHRLVRPGRFSARAEREYDDHTGRQSADVDRGYYARGHWRFVHPGDLILHGGGFEAGRCSYYHRLGDASPGGALPAAEDVAAWLGEPRSSTAVPGLREWLAHAAADPIEGLDWRDRFYLEQRLGGWLSALEQSLDLIDATRFHVANSAATYGLLLSLDVERRRAGEHQRDLIRRLAPRLLELPFNPDEDRFTRWQRLRYRSRDDPLAVVRAVARRIHRRQGAPADPASSR